MKLYKLQTFVDSIAPTLAAKCKSVVGKPNLSWSTNA